MDAVRCTDALAERIRSFSMAHGDRWATATRAEGECDIASAAFDRHLSDSGFAEPHGVYEFWIEPTDCQEGENHFANVVTDGGTELVIDWTARQFGTDASGVAPPYPFVAPVPAYVDAFGWESTAIAV